jgi:hypothetical protein
MDCEAHARVARLLSQVIAECELQSFVDVQVWKMWGQKMAAMCQLPLTNVKRQFPRHLWGKTSKVVSLA